MLIWDSHLDLAFLALNGRRNLLDPVQKTREKELRLPEYLKQNWRGTGEGTVAFPEMRAGRIAVCFATLTASVSVEGKLRRDCETPYQAFAAARGHLAYYQALEKAGFARIITKRSQLESHIQEWEAWENAGAESESAPPLGFIIDMEGADPIQHPGELAEWAELGLRILGPGHYGPGRYTGGTATELPLNADGIALAEEAHRLGMILDVNHLSDRAFWQAMEHFPGSVIASHSNVRSLVPAQRQLSDDQIRAIVERGGVIGVCMDVWMLEPNWVAGANTNGNVSLDTVVDHIDAICQLAGNCLHVGIGSDLDGGYGYTQCPHDLNTIADLQKLEGLLMNRGYSQSDAAGILYRNFMNLVLRSW